jgi:integrase/recombinase XerD
MNQVPIHPTTAHYLDDYLNWMEMIGRKITEGEYFFQPTKNSYGGEMKKRLSHTALGYIVGKWAKRVNKEKRITPHSARATFISSLIDIYYVSQLVNHADVHTTQRYNKRKRTHRRNPIFNLNFF